MNRTERDMRKRARADVAAGRAPRTGAEIDAALAPRGWDRIEGNTQNNERDLFHAEYERRAEGSQSIPTPQELLQDPCTPYWAADVIRVALTKDCCDASAVLSVLARSFDARTKKVLGL